MTSRVGRRSVLPRSGHATRSVIIQEYSMIFRLRIIKLSQIRNNKMSIAQILLHLAELTKRPMSSSRLRWGPNNHVNACSSAPIANPGLVVPIGAEPPF